MRLLRIQQFVRLPNGQRVRVFLSDHFAQVLVGTVILIALGVRIGIGQHFIDDAYITFRYARNLANGLGFVYNPGERVMGTSTPLFTLLLSAAAYLQVPLTSAAFYLGILSDGAIIFLMWEWGRSLSSELSGVVMGVIYALAPFSILAAISGMETSFYTLLLVLTFSLFLGRQYRGATIVAAVAALTRPEGFLVLAAIYVSLTLINREIPWNHLLIGVGILLPWLAFASFYFGLPIPNSVIAKLIVYPPDPVPLKSLGEIINQISNPFLAATLSPIIYMSLGATGIWIALRRDIRVLPMVLWMLLNIAFFSFPNRYLFPWYALPLLPFFLFFVILAITNLLSRLAIQLTISLSKAIYYAVAVLLLCSVMGLAILATVANVKGEEYGFAHRESVYACLGRQLYFQDPQLVVSSAEIGALGYSFEGKILDLTGLVTPSVLTYYAAPNYHFRFPFSIPPELIRESLPSVIVVFDSMAVFLGEGWFTSQYRSVVKYAPLHPYFGSLFVFVRRDVNPPVLLESCSSGVQD